MLISPRLSKYLTKENFFLMLCTLLLLGVQAIIPINSIFTSSTSNTGNIVGSAFLDISMTPANPTLIYNVSNLVPGDTATRLVQIHNSGNVDFTYKISLSANPGTTPLWTYGDLSKTLQIEVKDNDSGTVYYSGPISGLATPTSDITLAAGQTQNLQFKITFPEEAGNEFQNHQETLTFTFSATQLPGSERPNN
jgi:spore coat-associated protein N